jgi:hypothetical protein
MAILMKYSLLILALACLFSPQPGYGQPASTGTTQKLDPALRKFLQADFMVRLKDLRREAENGVAAFKLELNNYKPEDIQRVRAGYEKTADRFNQELENMKNDFLNKKKLKYIVEFPKDYARSLELNFKDLSDFYAQNFQQVLQDVRHTKEDGAIAIAILLELVKLVPEVVNHFREMKEMAARYDEAYLDKYLITPYKLPTWGEIQAEAGYMNNSGMYNNNSFYTSQPTAPASEQVNATQPTPGTSTVPTDTTQKSGGNWWETNSTLPYNPAGTDGAAPGKQPVKPGTKPAGTPPPNPFGPPSDTTKAKPAALPVKKNTPNP